MKSLFKKALALVMTLAITLSLTACNLERFFVFQGGFNYNGDSIETFKLVDDDGNVTSECNNSIFFALYNYYGFEGQHFTNKWLGMRAALLAHGIEVTGYEENKDAKTFQIKRLDNCDLPEDAVIYMVDNQEWDTGIQFKKPLAKYRPMAVISTCNGVEFAADPIISSGYPVSNATMGGFSALYKSAFENGTLKYLSAKYACHILPIIYACVDACDNGAALRTEDGKALSMDCENWAIQSLDEYLEYDAVDSISKEHPTLRLLNIKDFFNKESENYGAEKLTEYMANSSKEVIKAIYEENGTNSEQDTKREGKKLKCGLLVPSAVNETVQKYIDYINGYCAEYLNLEIIVNSITGTNTQQKGCETLINQKCDFIISLQDDTNRNAAINLANSKGVWFGIAGTCQNPIDYAQVSDLPYYIGSIGTSIQEEYRSAYEMTDYYLNCMIHRAQGDLETWQAQYKGLIK